MRELSFICRLALRCDAVILDGLHSRDIIKIFGLCTCLNNTYTLLYISVDVRVLRLLIFVFAFDMYWKCCVCFLLYDIVFLIILALI